MMEDKIVAAMELFKSGNDDAAMAQLLDESIELVPAIGEIFRAEHDPDLRAFLVRVAWERHEELSGEFILKA
ncbi:MAG TPA: hypothetical protein VGA27_07070, partial [Candidatus Binatia bacterium]